MSDLHCPRCEYCGPMPEVRTWADLNTHLASQSHESMVRLAADLMARYYLPAAEGEDES